MDHFEVSNFPPKYFRVVVKHFDPENTGTISCPALVAALATTPDDERDALGSDTDNLEDDMRKRKPKVSKARSKNKEKYAAADRIRVMFRKRPDLMNILVQGATEAIAQKRCAFLIMLLLREQNEV